MIRTDLDGRVLDFYVEIGGEEEVDVGALEAAGNNFCIPVVGHLAVFLEDGSPEFLVFLAGAFGEEVVLQQFAGGEPDAEGVDGIEDYLLILALLQRDSDEDYVVEQDVNVNLFGIDILLEIVVSASDVAFYGRLVGRIFLQGDNCLEIFAVIDAMTDGNLVGLFLTVPYHELIFECLRIVRLETKGLEEKCERGETLLAVNDALDVERGDAGRLLLEDNRAEEIVLVCARDVLHIGDEA